MKAPQQFFIIDFDSTFVKSEGLEELAQVSLKNNPQKDKILAQIKKLTNQGMEGKIPFEISLKKRLALLSATKKDVQKVVLVLKKKISPSIIRNRNFFRKNKNAVYVISGGFKELITPIVKNFGLKPENILANTFVFNQKGEITGVDKNNPLAHVNGKVEAVKKLELNGSVFVIGDGYTDYQIKQMGAASRFVAFTENVKREKIVKNADQVVNSFDEFLYLNKLPMTHSFPKSRIKVVLLEQIQQKAVSLFEKEGYSVEYYQKVPPNLPKIVSSALILGIRSRTNLDRQLLIQANKLLTIGAFCIGTDQIDLKNAAIQGISVFNAPYSNTRSVVELVIGEIIMLARGVFDKSTKLHQGNWDKSSHGSFEIRGKKLGIVGYGNIGSQLSVLAENLGMEVYFYDLTDKLSLGNAHKCKNFEELLKKCDIISVHVDGRKENKHLIDEKEFQLMKEGVLFLNLSRGSVVNIAALSKYLKNGKIRGAAVDVFPDEPKSKEEKFTSQLQNLPNVILTPHIGGSTVEAQENIAEFVSCKIIDFINSGSTYMSVNTPNIQLPKQGRVHRLLHFHRNVPNILAQINKVLGENKINIEAQYLKTNEDIGYVITDVDKKYNQKVIGELKKIPNTIRFRVLY